VAKDQKHCDCRKVSSLRLWQCCPMALSTGWPLLGAASPLVTGAPAMALQLPEVALQVAAGVVHCSSAPRQKMFLESTVQLEAPGRPHCHGKPRWTHWAGAARWAVAVER